MSLHHQHLGEWQAALVLLFYLLLAFSITTYICRTLYLTQYKHLGKRPVLQPSSKTTQLQALLQLLVFALLSILSLGSTWYYMFAFFAHSYRDWAACQK